MTADIAFLDATELAERLRSRTISSLDLLDLYLARIEEHFADARARRRELETRPDEVWDTLRDCGLKARAVAREVMDRVRTAVGF